MPVLLPATQHALQLVGPEKLQVNPAKDVPRPGPHQFVVKVEAVGICFSDLKLLKQFTGHARKGEVTGGIPRDVLAAISSYVPGGKPTVPGHEVVCRIVAVGENVAHHTVGERCLVQTDYRNLPTAGSNAAFGYNFEGGLQEYVLLDERVVIAPDGERYMIPVDEKLGASQAALVEPWACVEDSYVGDQRRTILRGGKLLVVADPGAAVEGVAEALDPAGPPASLTAVCADDAQRKALDRLGAKRTDAADPAALPNEGFDDVIYFGARKAAIETLNDKLAARAVFALVTGGRKIGEPVSVGIGRIHYGFTRWTATRGTRAVEAYRAMPADGEVRDNDRILVIGAGGPMGQMHVIRNICSGKKGLTIVGTDMDDARLAILEQKARPLAKANGANLQLINTKTQPLTGTFSYFAIMAPVGELVAQAVAQAADGAVINIFAGIPAPTRQVLDLDACIAKRIFMVGTSGSTIRDMKIVRDKVTGGRLDTDTSVDAVCGMAGAAGAIAAVANRQLAGKIVVYPMLHDMGLIRLSDLKDRFPTVAAKLDSGRWCKAAEAELLRTAGIQRHGGA